MGHKRHKPKQKQQQMDKLAAAEREVNVAAVEREVKVAAAQQELAELEKMLADVELEEKLTATELVMLSAAQLSEKEKLVAAELAEKEKLAAAELAEKEKLAAAELAEKEKLAAADLAEKEKLAAAELAEKEKQEAESRLPVLSNQVILSQKEMRDAFALQQKMVAEIMNSQARIATNEDLESIQDGVGGRLDALGKALVADVAEEIQKELISASRQLSQKAEKIISSKVKGALQKLDTAFKARVGTECEARVAVASVATGTKERMAMHIVEGKYEECFSMAVRSDKDSLGWLLTHVDPEGLPGLQLSKVTLTGLLTRLAFLVRPVGLYTGVYHTWFLAVCDIAGRADLDISDALMSEVLKAKAHVLGNA